MNKSILVQNAIRYMHIAEPVKKKKKKKKLSKKEKIKELEKDIRWANREQKKMFKETLVDGAEYNRIEWFKTLAERKLKRLKK